MLRSKQLHHGLTASVPAGKFNFMPRNPQFRPFHATSIAPASVTMRTFVSNVNPIHVTPVSCISSIHRIGYGLTMSLTAFHLQSHANHRHAQSMPLRWSHSLHSPATRSTSSRLPHARVRALPGVSSASPSSGSSSSSSNSSRTSNPSLIKRLRNSIRTFFSRSRLKIPFASTTPLTTASASVSDSNNSSSSSSTPSASSSSSPSSSSTDYPASPLLFDASHLLSGLHEDKKERLRCIEVDNSGNFRDVEFSRAELSSMLELHPRDLRFLDTSMRNLPSILARRKVIIVNLEMFKALITADRVLMFDPWYPHVQSVVAPLQTSILNGGELFEGKPIPFEFIALEHILQTVCSTLEDRFDLYISSLEPLLSSTESNDNSSSWSSKDSPSFNALVQEGSGSTLMHLLQLKNGLTSFEVTLRETGGALQDLLETDEDTAQMYLTEKASGHIPVTSEHNEVEVILETYFRKVDELENEVEQNVKSITLTEEHIQIRLDSNRNSMMKLELLVSISTLGVTTAALGAALFGMNLPSHLENNPYAFWASAGLFGFIAVGIIRQGLRICSRRGIDLFQIDPKEPTLRFPHMLQSTYAHSQTLEGLNGIALAKMRRAAKLQGIPLQPTHTQHNYARMFNHVNNGAKHPRCDHTR